MVAWQPRMGDLTITTGDDIYWVSQMLYREDATRSQSGCQYSREFPQRVVSYQSFPVVNQTRKDTERRRRNVVEDSSERRMVSSGMLRRVALVRTDVSEEPSASFIRVTRIGELGTMPVVTTD
jgi:hypothetical protein